jgi:hypothetical protein
MMSSLSPKIDYDGSKAIMDLFLVYFLSKMFLIFRPLTTTTATVSYYVHVVCYLFISHSIVRSTLFGFLSDQGQFSVYHLFQFVCCSFECCSWGEKTTFWALCVQFELFINNLIYPKLAQLTLTQLTPQWAYKQILFLKDPFLKAS